MKKNYLIDESLGNLAAKAFRLPFEIPGYIQENRLASAAALTIGYVTVVGAILVGYGTKMHKDLNSSSDGMTEISDTLDEINADLSNCCSTSAEIRELIEELESQE